MKRYLKTAVAALLPVVVAAGCTDFLKCSECTNDPNRPLQATLTQRFVAIQSNMWQFQEGDLARLLSMWMQSMAGTDRQFIALGTYVISEADEDGEFQRPYVQGGLVDLRALEAGAQEQGDNIFLGVAQVMEAWFMGTTADMWGDIPYSQAAKPDSFPTPELDSQQSVYAAIQSLLDQAIQNLAGSGTGPLSADLVYGGDPAKWTALAYTLKARFYLHTAERDPTAYAAALAAAQNGISSNAGDYVTHHTTTPGEWNDWYQFIVLQRSGYISAGSFMVDLLKSQNDPRRFDYYSTADDGEVHGADPGQPFTASTSSLSDLRVAIDYGQPIVTYNENLLIQAEAQFQGGDEAGALASLTAERAAWATQPPTKWHSAITLPALPGGLTGGSLLNAIMTEKYIALFQNFETWNDYKRTCVPALTPAAGASEVPARLYYGVTEAQTNPNIPSVAEQQANPHNWNDPNSCVD